MRDPDSPTGPPPPPYPDVSNLTQASAERIRNRQHQEDQYARTNYQELNKFIDDNIISRYSEGGKETVGSWKRDLLNLLQPFPYDPTFNFYTSVNAGQIHGKLIEVERKTKVRFRFLIRSFAHDVCRHSSIHRKHQLWYLLRRENTRLTRCSKALIISSQVSDHSSTASLTRSSSVLTSFTFPQ